MGTSRWKIPSPLELAPPPPRRAARVIRMYAQVRLVQNTDCVSSVLCSTLYLFCFAIVT
jgi:hypothetical protein